jgi:hypothetical protein
MNQYMKHVTFIDRELMEKAGAWNIPNGIFLIYANISINPNNLQSIIDKNIAHIDLILTAINVIFTRLDELEE